MLFVRGRDSLLCFVSAASNCKIYAESHISLIELVLEYVLEEKREVTMPLMARIATSVSITAFESRYEGRQRLPKVFLWDVRIFRRGYQFF